MINIENNKSIVMINIDDNIFLYQTDTLTREDKIHISVIADNPSEFIPLSHDMTPYSIAESLPTVIKEEVGIDIYPIGIDLEVKILNDCIELPDNIRVDNQLYIKADNWITGTIDGFTIHAKVFPKPSLYSIDNSRISKLTITDKNDNVIANYDRGWDVIPKEEYKDLYDKVIGSLEKKRLEMNKENKNRNKEYER